MKPTSPDYPPFKIVVLFLLLVVVTIAKIIDFILRPKSWKFYNMKPPN